MVILRTGKRTTLGFIKDIEALHNQVLFEIFGQIKLCLQNNLCFAFFRDGNPDVTEVSK